MPHGTSRTTSDRTLGARLAAHESWAQTANRTERTAPARSAFARSFEAKVDPEGILDPAERARRAESARKAYFARLALASVKARRARSATGGATTVTGVSA